ncbi:hypothetical protein CES85_3879 [Ochrobactrum quorumnocens]|uniref:Uncharacterized protein n=1 Tax=Ochrobactrum quorumnocens TaxID=271865 RepID=A0A248U8T3_9HYPH|nr:hypothetical protein CES85_3879 [[Ochrobactrum] quorumnocens]
MVGLGDWATAKTLQFRRAAKTQTSGSTDKHRITGSAF